MKIVSLPWVCSKKDDESEIGLKSEMGDGIQCQPGRPTLDQINSTQLTSNQFNSQSVVTGSVQWACILLALTALPVSLDRCVRC